MVIRTNFNGATLVKPGVYSRIIVENLTGFPLTPTGTVGIIGEAAGGQPGVVDIVSGADIQYAKGRYKSGPITDALELLMNPSNDTRVVNGASQIVIWKTNNSTLAEYTLKNDEGDDLFNLKTKNYGEDENRVSTQVSQGAIKASNATFLGSVSGPFDYSAFGGVQGVYSMIAVPDTGIMNGTYFSLPINATETEGFYMNVAGGTLAAPPALISASTRQTEVAIPALASDVVVKDALMTAINSKVGLSATNPAATMDVIVTLDYAGDTPASVNASSFNVTEVIAGVGAQTNSLMLKLNGVDYVYTTGINDTAVQVADAVADLNLASRWTPSKPEVTAKVSTDGLKIDLSADSGGEYSFMTIDPASLMDVVVGWAGETRGKVGSYIITNRKDQISEMSPDLGGLPQFSVEYTGTATSCLLTINWIDNQLVFKTSCVGLAEDDLLIVLEDANGNNKETISTLLTKINNGGKYVATFLGYQNLRNTNELDLYTDIECKNVAAVIYGDNYDIEYWYKNISLFIDADRVKGAGGYPAIMESAALLSGGSYGSSTNTDYSNGFEAFKNHRINVVVPLISKDEGSVSIDSVNFMARSHAIWSWSTTGRSERSVFVSYRGTKGELQDHSRRINSGYVQIVGQRPQVLNKDSEVVYLDEWGAACIAAGMRAGAAIGEPLTFKMVNAFGFKVEDGSWHPKFNGEEMIEAGVFLFEPTETGGNRILLGNTTYGVDQSFVWNRESVVQCVGFISYDLRMNLEGSFTGTKAKTGTAAAIANFVKARMTRYLNAEIIAGDDLNEGLGYRNLTVSIDGNVAAINVNVTPVQGIDFILPTIYVSDIRQTEVAS